MTEAQRAQIRAWQRAERRFTTLVGERPHATRVLIAVLVSIHLAMGVSTPRKMDLFMKVFGARVEPWMVRWGARDGERVADGEWWRIVSHGFLHWDMAHLFMNCLALWGLGRLCEATFGPARMLWIFLVSVVGGGLLSQTSPGTVVSAGASGGVFGLLGALVAYGLVRRPALSPGLRDMYGKQLWPWLLLNLGIGVMLPFVDNRAHVGGLVAGAVCGALLGDRITDNRVPRPWVTGVMLVVMTVVLAWTGVRVV